jgi:hypothetical protein
VRKDFLLLFWHFGDFAFLALFENKNETPVSPATSLRGSELTASVVGLLGQTRGRH